MPSGKKPTNSRRSIPREGISTRPTDSSGRRATDADLDMRAAGERPAVSLPWPEPSKYKPAKMPDHITSFASKYKPAKMPDKSKAVLTFAPTKIKPAQIIRTTVNMKPTPMAKKKK